MEPLFERGNRLLQNEWERDDRNGHRAAEDEQQARVPVVADVEEALDLACVRHLGQRLERASGSCVFQRSVWSSWAIENQLRLPIRAYALYWRL